QNIMANIERSCPVRLSTPVLLVYFFSCDCPGLTIGVSDILKAKVYNELLNPRGFLNYGLYFKRSQDALFKYRAPGSAEEP
ncbi:hypothetical protein JXL19_01450, partial [bacterium]|nr:hypothetical protein [bacterium]